MRVAILGAGKVGTALDRALAKGPHQARLVALRRSARARFDEALLVLCVRDPQLPEVARALAAAGAVSKRTAVVHVAGAHGAEALRALRSVCAGVGQAHPMLAFASAKNPPDLSGGHLLVSGDAVAVRRATAVGKSLGMRPRTWKKLDRALYHAAAGLVANGAAALSEAGARLLRDAGVPERDIPAVLGPLLRSVGDNVAVLGTRAALTGPIRRGDGAAVAAHLDHIAARRPELFPVYLVLAALQLELANALGEASPAELRNVGRLLGEAAQKQSSTGGRWS